MMSKLKSSIHSSILFFYSFKKILFDYYISRRTLSNDDTFSIRWLKNCRNRLQKVQTSFDLRWMKFFEPSKTYSKHKMCNFNINAFARCLFHFVRIIVIRLIELPHQGKSQFLNMKKKTFQFMEIQMMINRA